MGTILQHLVNTELLNMSRDFIKLTTSTVEKVLVSVSSFKFHLPLELHSEISVFPYNMSSKPSSSPASSASSISLLTNSS